MHKPLTLIQARHTIFLPSSSQSKKKKSSLIIVKDGGRLRRHSRYSSPLASHTSTATGSRIGCRAPAARNRDKSPGLLWAWTGTKTICKHWDCGPTAVLIPEGGLVMESHFQEIKFTANTTWGAPRSYQNLLFQGLVVIQLSILFLM